MIWTNRTCMGYSVDEMSDSSLDRGSERPHTERVEPRGFSPSRPGRHNWPEQDDGRRALERGEGEAGCEHQRGMAMRIAGWGGQVACSRLLSILSLVSPPLVTGACGSASGGQTGSESAECAVVESVPIPVDETSPMGFSAEDTLAYSEGDFADTMRWSDGSASPLAMTLVRNSDIATYLRSEYSGSGDMACVQVLTVAARIEASTEDGRLGEVWLGDLASSATDSASFVLELTDITGTLDLESFVAEPSRYDVVRWYVELQFAPDAVRGAIYGLGEGVEGDSGDPMSAVFEESILVGEFGP